MLSDSIETARRSAILEQLGLENKEYLLATIHRQGNTDYEPNLRSIVEALLETEEDIVFPIHPRTEKYLKAYGLYDKLHKHVRLIKPLGYLNFLKLMSSARKILTDSGGIQKEAYILGVPCITLRENTEWVETVENGWNILVGTDRKKIVRMVREFEPRGEPTEVFGRDASNNIIRIINGKG